MNSTTIPPTPRLAPPDNDLLKEVTARDHIQSLVEDGLLEPGEVQAAIKTLRQSKIFNLVTGSIEEPFRTALIRSLERILELTKS